MSDVDDQQDGAERLDDDKLEDGQYPPDAPLGVDAYGTTEAEERVDEPLVERVAREEPEAGGWSADARLGRIIDVDTEGGLDVEADMVGAEAEVDGTDRDLASDRDDLSAEESAMHIADPPPFKASDGYLDDAEPFDG